VETNHLQRIREKVEAIVSKKKSQLLMSNIDSKMDLQKKQSETKKKVDQQLQASKIEVLNDQVTPLKVHDRCVRKLCIYAESIAS